MLSEQGFAEWYYADNRLGERPDFKELWAFIQRHLQGEFDREAYAKALREYGNFPINDQEPGLSFNDTLNTLEALYNGGKFVKEKGKIDEAPQVR